MGLDFNLVKQRIAEKTKKGNGSFEKTDFKKIFWKPQEGDQTIRIVPAIWNRDYPIKNVFFHDNGIFKKTIYTLGNWGEKDPVIEFRKKLYAGDDDDKDFAKKIKLKQRFFVPVIVRGEESKGVRLWEFGSQTEQKLLAILGKQKLGDITDVVEGRDLEIEGYTEVMQQGKKQIEYVAVNILPDSVKSELSEDSNLVEKWLKEQKDPLEIYKKYTYKEIADMFNKWLNPEEETEPQTPAEEVEEQQPKPVNKKPVAKPKFQPEPREEDEDDAVETPDENSEEEGVPFVADEENETSDEEEEAEVVVKKPVVKKTSPVTKSVVKKPVSEPEVKTETVKSNTKTKVSAADKFKKIFGDDE